MATLLDQPETSGRIDKSTQPLPSLSSRPISGERYWSRDFMAKEWDHIWTQAWLIGGLVEQGSIQREAQGLTVRFVVTDLAHRVPVSYTGLRPGEKLYEELLIDAESEPTSHPLIYRATESAIPPEQLWPQIGAMKAAIQRQDAAAEPDAGQTLRLPQRQRARGTALLRH